jgi:V8-like Glu-specific endopeptidase
MWTVIFLFLSSALARAEAIHPDVVYDSDDQIELHQVKNSVSYFSAQTTVALFESMYLHDDGNGFTSVVGPTFGEYANLCKGERFAEQPSASFCSGVLVAPDVVLTAGHCVEDGFCKDTKFALDYFIDSPTRDPRKLETRRIFECDKVIAQRVEDDGGLDFALIKLKSIATSSPAPLNHRPMPKGQEITMIGFPAGIPMKVVEGAKVVWSNNKVANARLDAFVGNSGSPIFDSHTGDLMAILVSGETDFVWDKKQQCNRVKVCGGRWCEGEEMVRVSAIKDAIGAN